MVTTFPGLYHIYKSYIWNIYYSCTNRLSAFCLLWVIWRQHTHMYSSTDDALTSTLSMHHPPPTFHRGFVPITALSLLVWLHTNNSHTGLQQMPNTPSNIASRMSCLSSKRHNRAKSEQSQGDCNNQPKWLSEEEKSYHTLCESLMHFGDLESSCSALTKTFYKKQSSSFCCLYREAQTEENYLR